MNYDEAKAKKLKLESEYKALGNVLKRFPKGPMGLTPDDVKASPEFKKAKADFERKHVELQKFNKAFLKTFKKEYMAERRNRYMS